MRIVPIHSPWGGTGVRAGGAFVVVVAVVDGVVVVVVDGVVVVVVVAIASSNSARMSDWARAVTSPVPQSWKTTNSKMSSPTATRRRPKAAIARRIAHTGYRGWFADRSRGVTVRWSL